MKIQYTKQKRHKVKLIYITISQCIDCNSYFRQIVTYDDGATVSLRIPANERSSSDLPRLLCYVVEKKKGDSYKLVYVSSGDYNVTTITTCFCFI